MRLSEVFGCKMAIMAACAGLYWGASVLTVTVWSSRASVLERPSFYDCLPIMVAFLLICVLLVLSGKFKDARYQKALAFSGALFFCGGLVVSIAPLDGEGALFLSLLLQGCQTGCFIVFWGLGFASLSKEEAERTVLAAAIVAFALYGLGGLVPADAGGAQLASAIKAASVVPFLAGSYCMPVVERVPVPDQCALLAPFFASRVFFGVCMGVASCAALFSSFALPAPSPLLCIALVGTLCLVAIAFRRRPAWIKPVLRVAPIIVVGLLAAPYLATGQVVEVVCAAAAIVAFQSWIMLSSVQLSDIKERVGWDEARLSFLEKAVFSAGWLTAYLATYVVFGSLQVSAQPNAAFDVRLLVVYAVVLVACCLMASLIERKDKTRVLDKALELSEKQMDIIFREIAQAHGLTARESEVLVLLAKGYSRPVLCEKLVIAESTARSHSKHVYQKLGIHAREELYDLVEARKQTFSSQKSDL